MRFAGDVSAVAAPPIADVRGWVAGRTFPRDRPLLDVAQAVPTYPPAEALITHVAQAAARPDSATYTPILGRTPLRAGLAAHYAEHYRGTVAADNVAITAGCNQAFCATMMALAGPGDEVILPVPYYFNHQMWLDMRGVTARHIAFDTRAPGPPDLDAIAAAIGPRTRAIVLVTPNNPTGLEYPSDYLRAAFELAARHDVVLILDETYKDFRSGDGPPHDLFQTPGWEQTLVSLWSFSKSYGLTGYRVGSVVGGAGLLAQVEKILDCIAICAPNIGQIGATYALEHLPAWRDEKVAMMAARCGAVKAGFQRNDLRYELLACGAFFAYVRHPFAGETAVSVARRLADEQSILCVPGSMFGPGQEDCLRLAFANLDAADIPQLIERLACSAPG